jgi:hypothetical protein
MKGRNIFFPVNTGATVLYIDLVQNISTQEYAKKHEKIGATEFEQAQTKCMHRD